MTAKLLTAAQLEEAEKLAAQATEGPWVERERGGMVKSDWSNRLPEDAALLVSTGTIWACGVDVAAIPKCNLGKSNADMAFIAAARTFVPDAIATIRALMEALATAEAELAMTSQFLLAARDKKIFMETRNAHRALLRQLGGEMTIRTRQ